jgi:hypothetical protein
VCCQLAFPVLGCSLVQRSPAECDVPECDPEGWIMRRP